MKEWLAHKSSFMERLRTHGIEAKVQPTEEGWTFPTGQEKAILRTFPREKVFAREVLIKNDHSVFMFARTIFPRATLTGKEKHLKLLKNRSLGSVLFKDPETVRSEFFIEHLPQHSAWHQKIKTLTDVSFDLWLRRSIFLYRNKIILLTEIFFPTLNLL